MLRKVEFEVVRKIWSGQKNLKMSEKFEAVRKIWSVQKKIEVVSKIWSGQKKSSQMILYSDHTSAGSWDETGDVWHICVFSLNTNENKENTNFIKQQQQKG